jgi:hypothetical protein
VVGFCENDDEFSGSIKMSFFDKLNNYQLLEKETVHGNNQFI